MGLSGQSSEYIENNYEQCDFIFLELLVSASIWTMGQWKPVSLANLECSCQNLRKPPKWDWLLWQIKQNIALGQAGGKAMQRNVVGRISFSYHWPRDRFQSFGAWEEIFWVWCGQMLGIFFETNSCKSQTGFMASFWPCPKWNWADSWEQMESSPFQIHHRSFMKTDITNQKLFATPFQGKYNMIEVDLHYLISGDLHKEIMIKVCPYMERSELSMATLDV